MNSQNKYQGKYKQLQMIGKGRYGTIYRVRQLSTNKQYVAKHIPLNQIEQSVAKKQLQIIKNLRHPYIVEYIDSFISEEDFIIIMEYCKQKDLDHHVQLMKSRAKHFNQNLIITWLFQLVMGIQFIHSKKILHRDIKPQNVFIDQKMNIKIGDFGISKILASTGQQCATMTGTPFYLAPEIISEQLYTTKADIWSLGCVIYEICALQKPFESKGGILKLMEVIRVGEIKPIPKMYSEDLRKLVQKMMTRDQTKRPNTTQLLKDPILVDLMIKSSSSMSLRHEYTKNIEKPQTLTESFINKQTDMVHEQLKRLEQQVESKMSGMKKRKINSLEIDEQYQELKKKMGEIEKAIGKAFHELKMRAEGNTESNVSSEELKKSQELKKSTLQNSSKLTDSSDMTLIESVVIGEREAQRKTSKIVSGSASYESVPLLSTRNNLTSTNKHMHNSSIIMTESIPFTQQFNQSLKLTSKIMSNTLKQQQESFQQTLVSQYQQTHKSNSIAKETLDKLEFLQKAISRNPNSVLNGSLLSFTLTMSEDEIKRSIKQQKAMNNAQSLRLKSNNNLDDTINLDLSKRSSDSSLRFDKAFTKKKTESRQSTEEQQVTMSKINDEDQNQYYQEDFQQYEEDFDDQYQQEQNETFVQSGVQSIKQKRRLQMNTIRSFYQQSLQEINNQSEMDSNESLSQSQKVKNKYPLVMSEIKEQTGEAGSIVSKKNYSGNNISIFGI